MIIQINTGQESEVTRALFIDAPTSFQRNRCNLSYSSRPELKPGMENYMPPRPRAFPKASLLLKL